ARMGTPTSVLELQEHKGLYFRTPNGPNPWLCELDGQWKDVSAPQVAVSNNGKWLADKAINGQGIVMAPRWLLAPYLERGELQELVFDPPLHVSQNADLAVYLLYQKQRYLVPKVKVAVDFLVARVQGLY
ncbi:MAG: LysR family transcriptional regulator, partial [Pseudomonadales bacterium]|nr:LysR family transcriptional regulator [Pseudomonadales bacterium]